MFLTIIGGVIFVGSQAWEWSGFIKGEYGAIETKGGNILQFLNTNGERVAIDEFVTASPTERVRNEANNGIWYVEESGIPAYSIEDVKNAFAANPDLLIRTQELTETGEKTVLSHSASVQKLNKEGVRVVQGANLTRNEYGHPLFADFFFFITGFHGFHVTVGIILNLIIFFNVILGTYEKRGTYEMVEKVGLYWHFVDLVWVFVFTFFYLV